MFDEFDEFSNEPDDLFSHEKGSSAPLYIAPRPTTDYIELHFTLARFRVYRTVRLPRTFTFANLHRLIQYMFGWSDSHLHHAEVFPNVVLHNETVLLGTIKSCGRRRPLKDYELGDERAIADWYRFSPEDKPIYRVQPKVKERIDRFDGATKLEEKGVTLESIWTPKEDDNVSDGQCSNAQIGIIYTYNFCDEWNVHITCDPGEVFHHLDTPSNLPIFGEARGAPPIEHVTWDADFSMENEAEDKLISPRLFDVSYFQRYCQGTIISKASRTKLEILTLEEGEAQREEYLRSKKEKHEEYLQRQKEKQERIANGEVDEDEYDEDDDEECDDEEDEYE